MQVVPFAPGPVKKLPPHFSAAVLVPAPAESSVLSLVVPLFVQTPANPGGVWIAVSEPDTSVNWL